MNLLARSVSVFAMTVALTCTGVAATAATPADETAAIEQWRAKRLASLKSDKGWLTLAGLFWLKDGENTFGSSQSSSLKLDNSALAAKAGSFVKQGDKVRFVA